jgi:glycosyltransferase involved in cell wall biosynthesis
MLRDHLLGRRFAEGSGGEGSGYGLSDAYARAHACTYFSIYEGFGNAFVEAVLAKRPIFVNNYEPVYWPDIGSKGFKAVMLENNVITPEALEEMKKVIYDEELNREIGEYNFELGRKLFSYDTLEDKLSELIERALKSNP